jgi:hypothetical protein
MTKPEHGHEFSPICVIDENRPACIAPTHQMNSAPGKLHS